LENLTTTLEKEVIKLEISMQNEGIMRALEMANELTKD